MANLKKIFRTLIAYHSLKAIRTSPNYYENMKKNLFAMIRQLGPTTFFVTFTSAEHLWSPLCIALEQLTEINKQNASDNFPTDTIDSLIRKHPVICSHYYRHRIASLKNLLLKNEHIFRKVQDFFFTTKFQVKFSMVFP